jgi:pimeloyl-ACP methyl ester carboxylesterase
MTGEWSRHPLRPHRAAAAELHDLPTRPLLRTGRGRAGRAETPPGQPGGPAERLAHRSLASGGKTQRRPEQGQEPTGHLEIYEDRWDLLETPTPCVMTHGWPGSVVMEFIKVIDPLVDPVNHGGEASDALELVIPSLPGYGWSGKLAVTGWDVERIAQAWIKLAGSNCDVDRQERRDGRRSGPSG